MNPEQVKERLEAHIRGRWPTDVERFTWDLGTFPRDFPRFRVFCAAPRDGQPHWVYVSSGAWEADVRDGGAHEFILHSPIEERLHVEKLAALARRQGDPAVAKLVAGSVIAIGEPWLEGAACDHLYFTDAAAYPEDFEYLRLDGLVIHFLWMIPIHADEAAFIASAGREAFEDRLGETDVSLVDPQRPSVV